MKCKYNFEDLARYLDGLMCDSEKEELHKHLETCKDCRNHLGILKLTEDHIKEDVKNDGNTYLRVMESIDKRRYQVKKTKYRVGTVIYKIKPYIKPLTAAVLVVIIAILALNNQQYISNVLSSIEEFVSEKKENVEDKNKKEEKASGLFKAVSVSEINKGMPSDEWVPSEERGLTGVKDGAIKIKLYVKPDPNLASSKTTGEVMAYIEDGGNLYEIGIVSNYGTVDIEFKAQDLNNDGKNEISIKGQMGASSIEFKVIAWKDGKWLQLLDTDYTQVMDLDSNSDVELVCTSVGSLPPYVWIYRWNDDHFEKLDVTEATRNEYARLMNVGTAKVMIESGNSDENEKHYYIYKDGELIEDTTKINIVNKDNIINQYYYTYVTREVRGKNGPGEDFEDIIKIPYGRVINVIGMYTKDGGNSGWYVATMEPEIADDRSKIILPENQTEFYLRFDTIGVGIKHTVNFDECTVNDASLFNSVITGGGREDGTICLRQFPDEKSPTVSIAEQGNLINVVYKEREWSLVRIISGRAMEDYSDIGWLKNEYYSEYKPGMKVNQGFITEPFGLYDEPDINSIYRPLDSMLKSNIAPVTIIETDTKSGWSRVIGGFNGFVGWVKTEDIKFTFTSGELDKLSKPDVDLKLLTQKIREDIEGCDDLNICALDIEKNIKLTPSQRKVLAEKLSGVVACEEYGGGLSSYREAVYPFYVLEFSGGNENSNIDDNSDEPLSKYYRSSYSKFNFTVVGDDKLLIEIPSVKLKEYGLYREGMPIKFIKVNREFIDYFKTLITVPENIDKSNFNYLLSALKVEVSGGVKEIGVEPQQVCKTARVIKAFAGDEIKLKKEPDTSTMVSEFKFTFIDGSTERVIVFDNCLMYKGRYYNLNGPAKDIEANLFVAYF